MEPGGAPAPRPSLAGWKAGQRAMTSNTAGELVAKTAPKPKPKPPGVKRPKAGAKEKPWAERTKEEKFGTAPKLVHIGKQVKDVVAYLEAHKERESAITWEEIVAEAVPAWYDTQEGGELYNLLTHNPRVAASAAGFRYRSEHGISDKASLLRFLRSHPEGVRATDIKDGYDNVLRDAEALLGEGAAYRFYNSEFKVDVWFAAPEARAPAPGDLADAYLRTQLPAEPGELIASLGKLGMRSALANASSQRKPVSLMKAEKGKKKRRMQVRHLTNVHMAAMLTGADAAQFTSIDRAQ
ncbi:hypothetical protein HT031_001612 [Scenedesmus sp. PABB004]|nr:hypothetical protein HT031_001612 [Scenedesmus sp. PABB004]